MSVPKRAAGGPCRLLFVAAAKQRQQQLEQVDEVQVEAEHLTSERRVAGKISGAAPPKMILSLACQKAVGPPIGAVKGRFGSPSSLS